MFLVLVPLTHLGGSNPMLSWSLPMERRSHTDPWDYDQRDIAIHPERWESDDRGDRTNWPSWNPRPGPMR